MLLAAKTYDPATAVSKDTAAAGLAMTALDTTNLRNTFTVPSNGAVLIRLEGTLHGATTFPQILLGVMNGATVLGRVSPKGYMNGTAAATTFLTVEALFVVSGLTAGASVSLDAAYGVETPVTGTGLKYGGPNNATVNNAFGAFCFEVYDTV